LKHAPESEYHEDLGFGQHEPMQDDARSDSEDDHHHRQKAYFQLPAIDENNGEEIKNVAVSKNIKQSESHKQHSDSRVSK